MNLLQAATEEAAGIGEIEPLRGGYAIGELVR